MENESRLFILSEGDVPKNKVAWMVGGGGYVPGVWPSMENPTPSKVAAIQGRGGYHLSRYKGRGDA